MMVHISELHNPTSKRLRMEASVEKSRLLYLGIREVKNSPYRFFGKARNLKKAVSS